MYIDPAERSFDLSDVQWGGDTIREGRVYVEHEPGCGNQPRNPRGCHCGRDHQ